MPTGVAATALLPIAERFGVVFLPGPVCAPSLPAEGFEQYIRLCFAYESAEAIAEGVARLKAAIGEVRRQHGEPPRPPASDEPALARQRVR